MIPTPNDRERERLREDYLQWCASRRPKKHDGIVRIWTPGFVLLLVVTAVVGFWCGWMIG